MNKTKQQKTNNKQTQNNGKNGKRIRFRPSSRRTGAYYRDDPVKYSGDVIKRYIQLGFSSNEAKKKLEKLITMRPTPPRELLAFGTGRRTSDRTPEELKLLKKYCRKNSIKRGYRQYFYKKLDSGLSLEEAMQKAVAYREVSSCYRPISHDKNNLKEIVKRKGISGANRLWFDECIKEGYKPQQILSKMKEYKEGIDPCLDQRVQNANGEYKNLTWRRSTNSQQFPTTASEPAKRPLLPTPEYVKTQQPSSFISPEDHNNWPTSSSSRSYSNNTNQDAPKQFNRATNPSTSSASVNHKRYNKQTSSSISTNAARRFDERPTTSTSSFNSSKDNKQSYSHSTSRRFDDIPATSTSSVGYSRRNTVASSSEPSVTDRHKKQPAKYTSGATPECTDVNSKSTTTVTMALLPTHFTRHTLSRADLSLLESAVIEEVGSGWEVNLLFQGIHYGRGMLLVDCENFQTAEWLIYVAPRLKAWKGVELMACLEDNIPMKH